LRERLKRDFSVDLPELSVQEQATDLNSYFEAVAASVADNPTWSVRRFMNLSLFSFSGLGLYKDLDPLVVQKSQLIRQILSADKSSNKKEKTAVMIAEDESVDKPEISGKVPILITQADASQFAAIADVMDGRSLVIEGPPGTGKSQTITNIIANALYSGKKVLFVAEKKVALDVVYTRLSDAGLRDYCLRIASDKVNKREVYSELAERLSIVPPHETNRESTADAFEELRDELNEFSRQLNRGFGSDRRSYQMLIWEELYLRQLLKDGGIDLSKVRVDIENASSLTRATRDRSCQIYEQLAEFNQQVPLKRVAETFSHFETLPRDVLEREKLIGLASNWHSRLDALVQFSPIIGGGEDIALHSFRNALNLFCESLTCLPDPIDSELEWLIEPLSAPEMQERAGALLSAINAERSSRNKLEALFTHGFRSLPSPDELTAFLASWRQWRLGDQGMPQNLLERDGLAEELRTINEAIERIEIIHRSSQYSEQILSCTTEQLDAFVRCTELLARLPKEVLRTRNSQLWSCDQAMVSDYLRHYEELEQLRLTLGIDRHHPVLAYEPKALLKAAADIDRVESLGHSGKLASREKVMDWRSCNSQLMHLINRIDKAFAEAGQSLRYLELTVEQLVSLPAMLRELKALPPETLAQRSGALWDSSIGEIDSLSSASKAIQRLEYELRVQSLVVPEKTTFEVLKSAAKKLETTPWYFQAFDGDYSKALQLAKRMGANGATAQQIKALRNVARLLELKAKFPAQRFAELCACTSSFEDSATIVKQIDLFRSSLQSRGMDGLLGLARSLASVDIDPLVEVYDEVLLRDLSAVLGQSWLGVDVGKISYQELTQLLRKNQEEQAFVEQLLPFVEWHGLANDPEQSRPAGWLRSVVDCLNRRRSFPASELFSLAGEQCTEEESIASLQTLQGIRGHLHSCLLGSDMFALLRTIAIPDIEALSILLRDQLQPSLSTFADLLSRHGLDVKTPEIRDLLKVAKDSRQSFFGLVRRHAELGFAKDLSVESLVSAPIDLELQRKREQELAHALDSFQECGGEILSSVSSQDLHRAMAWIDELKNRDLPVSVLSRCLEPGSVEWIHQQSEVRKQLSSDLQQEARASALFLKKANAASGRPSAAPSSFEDVSPLDLCAWLKNVADLSEHLGAWIQLHDLLESLPSAAERQLASQLLDGSTEVALWPDLYRWNVVRSRLEQLTLAQPQLVSLRAADQVARRKRFAIIEDDLRRLDRAEVIAAIHNDPDDCPQGIGIGLKADFTEMGLILNESVKRTKHRPLRHLFQFAGNALRGLKPCWMMSPATVASLLPRGNSEEFDLVVIDEASQMSPERALGVISRAKQCVVVGDPQQLPPTSLFQRNASWEDSDDADEIDGDVLEEESILDLSSKAFQPTRRLKWHYRSRNGSLIAFSNKHFYGSQLVVFPSCRREFAITRHLVDEPRYMKGVNEPEVRDVCHIVLRQLELYPERSLGVVAMNEGQAEAIAEQLDDLAFHHDELRRRLDLRDNSEGLFVKPLEKVQGDERDTIVISTTYGPSEPGGSVPLRFGLLNRASGHRRLNVLFTRAKYAIELVTSLKSNQMRLPATAGPGLIAFRDYLRYVEGGSAYSDSDTVREPSSPFGCLWFVEQSWLHSRLRCGFFELLC